MEKHDLVVKKRRQNKKRLILMRENKDWAHHLSTKKEIFLPIRNGFLQSKWREIHVFMYA